MPRRKLIAGNWKMNTTAGAARELARAVAEGAASLPGVDLAVCPPFPWLGTVAEALKGSPVALGGQNLFPEPEGAFTGEVSAAMLLDAGCKYVIVGHSERRHVLGESDEFINRKIKAAIPAGLHVIFCVGELLDERQANRTEDVLRRQLTAGLDGVSADQLKSLVIAYEPVWAIGTGHNATPEQAQDAHAFIRGHLAEHFGDDAAGAMTIQYGGSVKPDNAAGLLDRPDVDGALVGGASLKADSFLGIARAAG